MAAKKSRFAALRVSLPEDLRRHVEQRVQNGGFVNVSEFIRVLIGRDQEATATPEMAPAGTASLPHTALRQGSQPIDVQEGLVEDAVLDFSSEEWRTLREALLRGERELVGHRLRDCARLFHTALSMTRARLRRDDPTATEEVIDARLRSWLHEHESWEVDTAGFRRAPERLRRILADAGPRPC